jgi:hypothetical protein
MPGTFIAKTCQNLIVAATCRSEEVVIRSRLDAGECGEVQAMADDGDGSARVPAVAIYETDGRPADVVEEYDEVVRDTCCNGSTLCRRAS